MVKEARGNMRKPCGDGTPLRLNWGSNYIRLHM